MGKYLNRPAITAGQEAEIFPLLDAALQLPFGKAIAHKCSAPRANYLSRILNGERYRNAIESLSMYTPDEPLYGKGLYYHLVIEQFPKGLLIASVKFPPETLTSALIKCAATKQPIDVSAYKYTTIKSRINKLVERHKELKGLYAEQDGFVRCITIDPEELAIVDIDIGGPTVPVPSPEQRAKHRAQS
jgi:hypothetical protein